MDPLYPPGTAQERIFILHHGCVVRTCQCKLQIFMFDWGLEVIFEPVSPALTFCTGHRSLYFRNTRLMSTHIGIIDYLIYWWRRTFLTPRDCSPIPLEHFCSCQGGDSIMGTLFFNVVIVISRVTNNRTSIFGTYFGLSCDAWMGRYCSIGRQRIYNIWLELVRLTE